MSDNELDAELLGMVGGESDDEGEEMDQTQAFDDHSAGEEAKESVEKVEEAPRRTKGVAQKVKGRKKKARKQESEDEHDLGNDSPSQPDSLGSGAMEESDGEVDASGSPEHEDAPLFPLEGKYSSAQDREDLLAKPEIEREEILAERANLQLKRHQDLQLKKALATAQAANKNKRKAAAAELEDGGRRTRPKAEKTKTALDDYKRARELKGTERGRQEAGKSRKDERSPSQAGSDRDADGESEVEWAAEPANDHRHRDEPPAEMRDFERCRIGRTAFARVCFFPGFEDAIMGCFARVSIGVNRETGQNQYRMVQIKGFKEGRPYELESSNGKKFSTDVYAVVAHGAAEKPWPFSACSDGKLTDQEYDRHVATLKKENIRPPSRKYLTARVDAINSLLNMEWTDEKISKKLANQRAMERKLSPVNAAKLKLEKIQKRKQTAEESGDADELMRCDAELAALENNALTAINGHGHGNGVKASPTKKAGGPNVQQEALAQLNLKNRGKNVQDVRKALLEEKRKLQIAREQAAVDAKIKAEADAKKALAEQEQQARLLAVPFGRSEMADLFGDSDASRAGTPVPGGTNANTPRRSRAGTPLNGVKKEKGGLVAAAAVGAIKKRSMDDEVIGSLDMGIDVEI
ncbi:RNA polymerase-associated protein rtf1 [Friedmanniomyces endolithicus]|nr:RNA polymerase-associated protein rtf1 [Friedmanniomyces endolithicus]